MPVSLKCHPEFTPEAKRGVGMWNWDVQCATCAAVCSHLESKEDLPKNQNWGAVVWEGLQTELMCPVLVIRTDPLISYH